MTEKKLTKIEKFEMLLNYEGVVADNPIFVELIEHEMELIRKKNSYKSVNKKKLAENEGVIKDIEQVFYDEPTLMMSCSDIVRKTNYKYSTQKLSPQLKKMVENGILKETIEKKIKYFQLV